MCNVSYGYMLEGVEKGCVKISVKHIKRLMSEMGLSTVEAMKILDIPADQHEQILALLFAKLNN